MSENEKALLAKLNSFISNEKTKNIQKGLENLYENKEGEDKKEFINILLYIIEGNNIIKDDLCGFKDIICQKILDILDENKYGTEFLLKTFSYEDDKNFLKIFAISILLSFKLSLSPFYILFHILIKKQYNELNEILEKNGILGLGSNKLFVERICLNKYEDLMEFSENGEEDITKFLKVDNKFFENYINNNNSNDKRPINDKTNNNEFKKQQNLKSISDDNNKIIINNIIKENENEDKIIKEKRDRIFRLINKSIKIKFDKKLTEEDDILKSNYNKVNNNNKWDIKKIMIDNYDIKIDNNLYLFSPISLILNNLKKEFDTNDFEIFNRDNHYVEVFGNYLKEIIIKLNEYINYGEEEKYIKENKIKFGCYNHHFYLCCKFNVEFKNKYYEQKIININSLIDNNENPETKKVIIKSSKEGEERKEGVEGEEGKERKEGVEGEEGKERKEGVEGEEGEEGEERKEGEEREEGTNKNKSNNNCENNIKEKDTFSTARYSKDNVKNKLACKFENDVREIVVSDKNDELQNLLFFFNLKIPKKHENIKLESVTLFYNTIYDNLYGFREIDICSQKKKEKLSDILENNYTFKNKDSFFKKNDKESIDVEINDNTLLFSEIKSSFPIIIKGSENYYKIKIDNNKKKTEENNYSITIIEQLGNLMKKAKIFFDFFQNEGIINKNTSIHILYIYDAINISYYSNEIDSILQRIENFFNGLKLPLYFKNAIFQIAYFNNEKNEKRKTNKLLELEQKKTMEIVKKDKEDTIARIRKENEDNIAKIKKEKEDTITKIKKKMKILLLK